MDLLSFATSRKLQGNHELLDYVAIGQPVPINVLDASISELIQPLRDQQAELLVSNYQQLLRDTVPLGFVKQPDDTYRVTGEIPDNVLDSITLVHQVEQESIISQMISDGLASFDSGKDVVIGKLTLHEQMAELLTEISDTPEIAPVDMVASVESMSEQMVDQVPAVEQEATELDRLLDELNEQTNQPIVDPLETTSVTPIQQSLPDRESARPTQPELAVVSNNPSRLDNPSDDRFVDVMTSEPQQEDDSSNIFEDIYNKLVADLRAMGLDKSLNLVM